MIYQVQSAVEIDSATTQGVAEVRRIMQEQLQADAAADGKELVGGIRETVRQRMRNTIDGPKPMLLILTLASDSRDVD